MEILEDYIPPVFEETRETPIKTGNKNIHQKSLQPDIENGN